MSVSGLEYITALDKDEFRISEEFGIVIHELEVISTISWKLNRRNRKVVKIVGEKKREMITN